MKITTGAFDNLSSRSSLSPSTFYAILGSTVCYGLALTAILASLKLIAVFTWPLLIGLIVLGIAGIFVSVATDEPIVKFIGYNMIIVPFGLMMGSFIDNYSPGAVSNAALITAIIAGIMTVLSSMFPQFFSKIGFVLFISLSCLVVVRILQMFIPALYHMRVIDYISAGIFSLYIGYDMWRASEVSRTVSSAIGIAIDLYLDLINLFLSILGRDDD